MVRIVSVVLVLLVLTACSDELFSFEEPDPVSGQEEYNPSDAAIIETKIREEYFDPDALKMRNVRYFNVGNYEGLGSQVAVCGESNGKNRYGAYTGYEYFYARYNRDKKEVMFSEDYEDSEIASGRYVCDGLKRGEPVILRY